MNMLKQLTEQVIIEWLSDKETYFGNLDEIKTIQATSIDSIDAWSGADDRPLVDIWFNEGEYTRELFRYEGTLAQLLLDVLGF